MSEMYLFKIPRADVQKQIGGVKVRLWYPSHPEPLQKRLPADPEFGVQVFENLRDGYAQLANPEHPIRPSAAGSAYLFEDGVILFHRRDKGAPTHKLYHSIPGGFPRSQKELYSAEGLKQTGLRETAEENLLITKDANPRLLVPKDSAQHVAESAKRFGIDWLPKIEVETEILEPSDVLEVYSDSGDLIYSARGFVCFVFDSERSITTLQIRKVKGIRSDEILPIDTEHMESIDGKITHFNRESYMCPLGELDGKKFGDKLDNPKVYRTEWEQVGDLRIPRPKLWTPSEPFLGPDAVVSDRPHVWAPDDMFSRILDGLYVQGFAGKWKEIELEKEKNVLEKK